MSRSLSIRAVLIALPMAMLAACGGPLDEAEEPVVTHTTRPAFPNPFDIPSLQGTNKTQGTQPAIALSTGLSDGFAAAAANPTSNPGPQADSQDPIPVTPKEIQRDPTPVVQVPAGLTAKGIGLSTQVRH